MAGYQVFFLGILSITGESVWSRFINCDVPFPVSRAVILYAVCYRSIKAWFEGIVDARSSLLFCMWNLCTSSGNTDGQATTFTLQISFRQLPRRQENTLTPEVGFAGLKNFPGCVCFSKELDGGYGGEKVVGFSPLAKKIGVSPTLANSRHPMILIIISLASGTFLPLLPLYFLSVYSFLEIYTRMTGWSEYAYCSEQSIGYRAFAHLVGMC